MKLNPLNIRKYLTAIAVVALVGVSSAQAENRTISGTLHKSRLGVSRTVTTREVVVWENGRIVSLPPGAIVQLRESGPFRTVVAELRERDGKPELWINESGTFRKATAADEAWFAKFMRNLG